MKRKKYWIILTWTVHEKYVYKLYSFSDMLWKETKCKILFIDALTKFATRNKTSCHFNSYYDYLDFLETYVLSDLSLIVLSI